MKYYFSLLACLVSFIAHAQTTYSYRVEGELTDNSFNGRKGKRYFLNDQNV